MAVENIHSKKCVDYKMCIKIQKLLKNSEFKQGNTSKDYLIYYLCRTFTRKYNSNCVYIYTNKVYSGIFIYLKLIITRI